ncbi:hypothetical protein JHK87_012362 [Glycine soja]|nr:hypothetical protein JHK87_012362 [Glycine soja]
MGKLLFRLWEHWYGICWKEGDIPPLVELLEFNATKFHISQGGAIPPLVYMLKSPHVELREMSAFAIGRLAQPMKDCIANTLKRLEKKIQGRVSFRANSVLEHLISVMCFLEKGLQIRVTIALVYLCSPHDELLLDILKSSSEKGVKEKGDASATLHKLAAKASCLVSPFDAFPLPTPQDLSRATYEYHLDGLKSICEEAIAQTFECSSQLYLPSLIQQSTREHS